MYEAIKARVMSIANASGDAQRIAAAEWYCDNIDTDTENMTLQEQIELQKEQRQMYLRALGEIA